MAETGAGTRRVAVLGLGNVLMEDDALGPHVIQNLLAAYAFPDEVAVLDLGTPGLDLAPFLMDLTSVVFVDTVHAGAPPGTVRLYRRDEILKVPPQPRVSPHDPALKETLLSLEFSGQAPRDVLLVGVVPKSTVSRVGLSPEVRDAIPAAVAEVLRELERLGVPAVPAAEPTAPALWWEESRE